MFILKKFILFYLRERLYRETGLVRREKEW